ncbi:MAG: zinc ribbon domain-containing protein, partial [Saccharofermentanales bacterium]
MSFYCKACGALMRDDNKYCENCGTAVVQSEKKTCPNCGTICSEGARFCRICRSPLEMKTSSVVKRKSPAMTIIASVLVLALILGAVSIGINKCNNEIKDDDIKLTNITYSEKDLKAAGTKISVSPENFIAAAGNITVDLGAFNLYGESTLEVKTLPEKSDSRTGLTVQAYDFSLSDNTSGEMLTEFPTLVDIMIPCTASAEEYAFIQYYNKETQEWHVIDSQRDYENNTLTFQTTHFSIYGESKMILGSEYNFDPDENTVIPSQSFAYIGGYDGPLTEVYFVSADLDKLMDSIDYDKMIEILNSCKVYPEDMATALMGLGNDAANVLDLSVTNKLINTMLRAESGIQNWAKTIRLVGSALVFAKVAYQLYLGGDAATVAYMNAVNLTEALLTVAGVALGSEVLLTMAMVVFLSNTVYSLATLELTSIQEQGYINFNDGSGAVFYAESMHVEPRDRVSLSQEYYIPSGPILLDRGGKGFARALDAIYIHYKDKPADLQKALENLINEYVNCFWDSKGLTDADRVHYSYYKEGYNTDDPPIWIQPSPAKIQEYKDKFRRKLMSDIKPLMKEFSERVFHDLKLKLRETIENEYVPFLN